MRTQLLLIFCLACAPFAGRAWANRDSVPPLLTIEKTYGASAPLNRIVARFDGSDDDAPQLSLRTDTFEAQVPTKMLRFLPRPDWEKLSVRTSRSSINAQTGKLVERPSVYLSVPLRAPKGKNWPAIELTWSFESDGSLSERRLSWELPPTDSKFVEAVVADWPLDSDELADAIIERALAPSQTR